MGNKKETKFEIKFQAPLKLIETPSSLTVSSVVKWRVITIDIKEIDKNEKIFVLTLDINQEDINEETKNEELLKFRDVIVSLLSFVTLCPIRLMSKGTFTFHLRNDSYQQKSLGPMKYSYSSSPADRIDAFVNGLVLSDDYMSALYFMEKAIGAEQTLYEFINIAICCELIIGKDSSEPRSVNPKCKDGHVLTNCPICDCSWLIPNSLRNRSRFIMDELLSKDFIEARGKVFHGDPSQITGDFLNKLKGLNMRLLVCLRNYLGQKINLPSIREENLPAAIRLKDTNIIPSVFYKQP